MAQYATAHLEEIDELADHDVRYRPVRPHLGITSFGVTAWTAHDVGDPVVAPFDSDSEPAEELFLVVTGRAHFEIAGETVEATPGTLVHCRPGANRTAVATEPDTTVLAVDGSPGKAYSATGCELVAAHPQYPMLAYNLACVESLSGWSSEAVEHLLRAVSADEKYRGGSRGHGLRPGPG